MERDAILRKVNDDVRNFSRNGMFVPRELLPAIIFVKGKPRVEILGESLAGGQRTERPEEIVGIRISFEDVTSYDRFWSDVYRKKKQLDKITKNKVKP